MLHVESFWYGYVKLMEAVNGIYQLDITAFKDYCTHVAEGAERAAGDLAELMSDRQLAAFCESVRGLSADK